MIDYNQKLSNGREAQVPSHKMSTLVLLETLILKKMLASVSCYFMYSIKYHNCSDSFTILGLWVLGLTVSNINESQLQTNESKTLFLMTSLPYYCIPGLAEIKTYAQKMQDA